MTVSRSLSMLTKENDEADFFTQRMKTNWHLMVLGVIVTVVAYNILLVMTIVMT
jgi:hypothetical protein